MNFRAIAIVAGLIMSTGIVVAELEHGDCETASNWAGAEPSWYAQMCELPPFVHVADHPRGVVAPGSQAYMLNFGIFSPAAEEGVLTYPMPDILDLTQINPNVGALFSADFDQISGVLYAVNNDDFSLGTVDLVTGDYTPIATITGVSGTVVTGLAWDPTTGTWYLTVNNDLYTIDPTTAVATPIGATGIPLLIEIKFDSSGQLYATSIDTGSLYAVDKSDASSTLIGALGFAINFAQGMAYDYDTDTMWAWLYQGGGNVQWATINLATGAATSVQSFSGNGPEASGAILGGFGDGPIEIPEFTPVPTLNALGLGILALMALMLGALMLRRRA